MKLGSKLIVIFLLATVMFFGIVYLTPSLTVTAKETESNTYTLERLNVLCLGDSITAGQGLGTNDRWTNVLANKYGWTLTNKSQGGISLSSYYYTANNKTDVSIAKKAEVLKTMPTPPDMIIVWGGHNDVSYRYSPIGTWDDETTDSFKGALKHIAKLADEYAPDATLFVLTPIWNNEKSSTLKVPENTTDTDRMFIDAIYEGSDIYGWIPINMDLCGITPYTKAEFLLDGIHPNTAGTEKIVEFLSKELACYGKNSKRETIILNQSDVSFNLGESTILKATLTPRSGYNSPTFTWSSSNTSVATVDYTGLVKSIAPGKSIITATASNGTTASVDVFVPCSEHTYKNGVCAECGEVHPNLENYKGKVISVLGDSISTFKGYIPTADGFNEAHPSTYPSRDVQSWDKTWWGLVIDRVDAKLGINDSWSGSRVQNTYNAENPGGNVGTKVCMSSMTRISNLGTNGTPDVILIYGGTNDGKFSKFGGFDPNQDYSQVDLDAVTWSTFEEAYVAMIMRLQYLYPNAKIVVVLPTHVSSWYTDEKLEIMNTSIKQICEYFNIEYVNTPECGITLEDLPDGLHPNAKGMEYIANAVLDILLNSNEITKGENIVHSIEHKLNGVTASNGHYKGISSNNTFAEKLTGTPECVRVTMNGVDITADCYKEGNIYIESVSGDVIITAKQHNYDIAVTPPTCTEQGFTTYTCDCGDSYIDDYKDATGEHIYENGVCTGCGDVKPGPTIVKQPIGAMKNLGEDFTFTVEAEGDGLTYQWYYKDALMTEFEKSCVTTSTYSFEMLDFRVGREYYCIVSDKYGNSAKADIVKSTTPLTIIEQPKDALVDIGGEVNIWVKAVGEGLTYQWYYKESGDTEFKKSMFVGTRYSRSMEEFCQGRQVYCIISDANGSSVQTNIVEMTRTPKELTITEQPKDVEAEIGQQFEVTFEAEGDGLTYQWYYKDAYMENFEISVNKTASYSYTMEDYRHGRQLYCIVTDKYGNTRKTNTATLTSKAR